METYELPEMLAAEIDHEANNSGHERVIELFDLLAEQIQKVVPSDALDVLAQDLFTGDAVRGVSDQGVEVVIFHHSVFGSNVLVQRDGYCVVPSSTGIHGNMEQLGYEEIYDLFKEGSLLEMPVHDAIPRADEIEEGSEDHIFDAEEPPEPELGYTTELLDEI